MTSHTPGPYESWEVEGQMGVSKAHGNGADLIHAVNESNRSREEQRANMQLFAAAPELLAALENLAREVTEYFGEEGFTLPEARAAIAKAKGEMPNG